MELLQNYKEIDKSNQYNKRDANKYFMKIENDLNNLTYELNQVQQIYNNLDENMNNFLNDNSIIQAFIIGYYHFKNSYKVLKDVDIITDNKKVFVITKEHIKTIKQVINYYDLIINEMRKKANKKQLEIINKFLDHYK